MNLLFAIPNLTPGGAEHQTVNHVNFLFEHGHDVSLVVFADKLNLLGSVKLPPERVLLLRKSRLTPFKFWTPIQALRCVLPTVQFIRRQGVTHVVANLFIAHFVLRVVKLLGVFGLAPKVKLACYDRSLMYSANALSTLFDRVFFGLNKVLGRLFDDGHVFISEAVRRDIEVRQTIRRGAVIHNSVPVKTVDGQAARQFLAEAGWGGDERFLVVVPGRVHEVKGQVFFLKNVCAMLADARFWSGKKPLFIFAGSGPDAARVAALVQREKLENQVFTTGYLPNELLLSFLAAANLVVIPSLHEGFGNVAVEALMQGAQMLASDVGGLPEIIRHDENGWLFRAGDGTDLREKLAAAVAKPAFFDKEKLRSEFLERFTLERQMEKLLGFLKAV